MWSDKACVFFLNKQALLFCYMYVGKGENDAFMFNENLSLSQRTMYPSYSYKECAIIIS